MAFVKEKQLEYTELQDDSYGKNYDGSHKSNMVFTCQQAHDTAIGLITGFSNVKQLYKSIAVCLNFPCEDILFCTLNTNEVDMQKLLSGHIALGDRIFAHTKGLSKEIEIVKTESLGVIIAENGAGYTFIKRIKEGSIASKIPHIKVGDHIENIYGINMVGKRHYEVARTLKEIPLGASFIIRLVEPLKCTSVGSGENAGKITGILRFKWNGETMMENNNTNQSKQNIYQNKGFLKSTSENSNYYFGKEKLTITLKDQATQFESEHDDQSQACIDQNSSSLESRYSETTNDYSRIETLTRQSKDQATQFGSEHDDQSKASIDQTDSLLQSGEETYSNSAKETLTKQFIDKATTFANKHDDPSRAGINRNGLLESFIGAHNYSPNLLVEIIYTFLVFPKHFFRRKKFIV